MKLIEQKSKEFFYRIARNILFSVYHKPDLVLCFAGGIGDQLLCTILTRELKKEGKRIWFVTDHKDLFKYNPDVAKVFSTTLAFKLRLNIKYVFYETLTVAGQTIIPDAHIVKTLCNRVGIHNKNILLKPVLYLSAQEKKSGEIAKNKIIISSSGMSARHPIITKEWFPERYQQVVASLKGRYEFIQVGSLLDPLLEGVIDMRGKLKPRDTASLLSNALLYIGQVGFIMHLARSVDCVSVIIYGGREKPWQSGYKFNHNLCVDLDCSPCWGYTCPIDRLCLRQITPAKVSETVELAAHESGRKEMEMLCV